MKKFKLFFLTIPLILLAVACSKSGDNENLEQEVDGLIRKQFVYEGKVYTVKGSLNAEGLFELQDDSEAATLLTQLFEKENLAEYVGEDEISMFFDNFEQLELFLQDKPNAVNDSPQIERNDAVPTGGKITIYLYNHMNYGEQVYSFYLGEEKMKGKNEIRSFLSCPTIYAPQKININDIVTSFRVTNGTSTRCMASITLFEHIDFGGKSFSREIGWGVSISNLKDYKRGGWFLDKETWNDAASSLKIH